MMTLEKLNELYPNQMTNNLDIITFTYSIIIYEDIYEKVFNKPFNKKDKKDGAVIDALYNQKWDKCLL